MSRYQKRISGPLLDRIDIHVEVPRVEYEKLADDRLGEPSARVQERVLAERRGSDSGKRFAGTNILCNADIQPKVPGTEESAGHLARRDHPAGKILPAGVPGAGWGSPCANACPNANACPRRNSPPPTSSCQKPEDKLAQEAVELLDAARQEIKRQYQRGRHGLRRALENFFYRETRSRPVVLPRFIQV